MEKLHKEERNEMEELGRVEAELHQHEKENSAEHHELAEKLRHAYGAVHSHDPMYKHNKKNK